MVRNPLSVLSKVAAVDQATTHAARKTASDEAQVAIKAEVTEDRLRAPLVSM